MCYGPGAADEVACHIHASFLSFKLLSRSLTPRGHDIHKSLGAQSGPKSLRTTSQINMKINGSMMFHAFFGHVSSAKISDSHISGDLMLIYPKHLSDSGSSHTCPVGDRPCTWALHGLQLGVEVLNPGLRIISGPVLVHLPAEHGQEVLEAGHGAVHVEGAELEMFEIHTWKQ